MDRTENKRLSHLDEGGRARMVDVTEKGDTARIARARGSITFSSREAWNLVQKGETKKGDILTVAKIAGIGGAKRTGELIPLCHPLVLTGIDLSFRLNKEQWTIEIEAEVRCTGKTGVEMEALTSVSVAALTIYDMGKAVDKGMVIGEIRLMEKRGGRSGTFMADW